MNVTLIFAEADDFDERDFATQHNLGAGSSLPLASRRGPWPPKNSIVSQSREGRTNALVILKSLASCEGEACAGRAFSL